jgi:poly-gamma-glutamate capsule biosynthesis protein CapA/YwtB (metallophosphatase superfamily)
MSAPLEETSEESRERRTIRLFLSGDVMTGRGIDQVMRYPCDPALREGYVHSARGYVRLAEQAHGPIPRNVDSSYIWGVALDELDRARVDARIVNLETAVTRSDAYLPKGINYRMSPENAHCLTAAGIDCCTLANNHVLDFGPAGLIDTLTTLNGLSIKTAGAGRNPGEASAPAIIEIAGKNRVLVFSFASVTSGTPLNWAATKETIGVNLLAGHFDSDVQCIADQITSVRRPHDVIVVSIHWGANWGHEIPAIQRRFAHALIADAGVAVVHGHSSHHAKAIEVHRGRLILYGCGDLLNDYEAIRGHEEYRGDLCLMYLADIDSTTGDLAALEMVPVQIRQFRLVRSSKEDVEWLRQTLDRVSLRLGASIRQMPNGRLALLWPEKRAG